MHGGLHWLFYARTHLDWHFRLWSLLVGSKSIWIVLVPDSTGILFAKVKVPFRKLSSPWLYGFFRISRLSLKQKYNGTFWCSQHNLTLPDRFEDILFLNHLLWFRKYDFNSAVNAWLDKIAPLFLLYEHMVIFLHYDYFRIRNPGFL